MGVIGYETIAWQDWDVRGAEDGGGNSFNAGSYRVLHPGKTMTYALDLLDTSAGSKTSAVRFSWGTPTSVNGRVANGITPIDQVELAVEVEVQ